MERECRFVIEYISPITGEITKCYPMSVDSKNKCLETNKRKGIETISVKRLYPFSTVKNQHNFDLIISMCYNMMCEMERGEREWDDDVYEALSEMRQDAQECFQLPLPVAWLPYEQLHKAKDLVMIATSRREAACIENGRLDLLKYC